EFAASPLGRRIGDAQERGTLRRERSFVLKTDVDGQEAMVQGMIDCFFEEDGMVVLVDYKTTSPRNVPGVKERYSVQMDIYRRAITSATGLEVKEAYLYLTNLGLTVDM
ncbi:MAG: PD-(D/E)XK nuclease family protein, partial [Firmicutes bacterium]|nr:PD-(D/E)XK nuclease family protein [Bacillota bacterium]